MTKILPATSRRAIQSACHLLREGEVVAFPTDTVYGVGVDAFARFALRRLLDLKQRPLEKGLPLFIYQVDDLNLVARQVPNWAWPVLQHFWPGPLTVVLPKNPALPPEVTDRPSVAVRIPDHPVALDLVIGAGRPLAVTSANLSGRPTPATAQEVAGQLGPALPLVLDGGPSPGGPPSTIIDLSQAPPRLLRAGPLSVATLQPFLPDLVGPEDEPA
jgi:L-threonylcarbamoyladenylate synthase